MTKSLGFPSEFPVSTAQDENPKIGLMYPTYFAQKFGRDYTAVK